MFWSQSSTVAPGAPGQYWNVIRTGLIWLLAMGAGLAHGITVAELDEDFQTFSHGFYTALGKQAAPALYPADQLESLLASDLSAPAAAILIRSHKQLLWTQFETDLFWSAMAWLYRANDTATVREFMEFIKKQNNPKALARSWFLLARYYEERGQWAAVQGALTKIENKFLPPGDAEYAVFLRGFALQQVKQHRPATDIYRTISSASPWYPHARLNEGIAYLRQGWWSEAHLQFHKAIAASADAGDDELENRLLVVLGYSQLHFEFYRDARETFRKVNLDSIYAQRALLGLGLAAAHQTDFQGALNAFLRLAGTGALNASVDEAWLLVPYAYEELGQRALALESYEKAKSRYRQRLVDVEKSMDSVGSNTLPILEKLALYRKPADETAPVERPVPAFIEENFRLLQSLQTLAKARHLSMSADELLARYERWINQALRNALEEQKDTLNGYQSQVQFGLARLYDDQE